MVVPFCFFVTEGNKVRTVVCMGYFTRKIALQWMGWDPWLFVGGKEKQRIGNWRSREEKHRSNLESETASNGVTLLLSTFP